MGDETRGKITCPHCGKDIALTGKIPPQMDCGFFLFLLLLVAVSILVILFLFGAVIFRDMTISLSSIIL